jgi:hypothetical protein
LAPGEDTGWGDVAGDEVEDIVVVILMMWCCRDHGKRLSAAVKSQAPANTPAQGVGRQCSTRDVLNGLRELMCVAGSVASESGVRCRVATISKGGGARDGDALFLPSRWPYSMTLGSVKRRLSGMWLGDAVKGGWSEGVGLNKQVTERVGVVVALPSRLREARGEGRETV